MPLLLRRPAARLPSSVSCHSSSSSRRCRRYVSPHPVARLRDSELPLGRVCVCVACLCGWQCDSVKGRRKLAETQANVSWKVKGEQEPWWCTDGWCVVLLFYFFNSLTTCWERCSLAAVGNPKWRILLVVLEELLEFSKKLCGFRWHFFPNFRSPNLPVGNVVLLTVSQS